jgi:hypothetical protein
MSLKLLLLAAAATAAVYAQDANREVVLSPNDVGSVVDRVEKKSGDFKGDFGKAVEHSTIDDTKFEDNAKKRADELHDAAKKLGDVFHDKRDKNHPAVREQTDKTIAAASELNRVMNSHRFTDKLQQEWGLLRADLNALAAVYNLSPLKSNGSDR